MEFGSRLHDELKKIISIAKLGWIEQIIFFPK